MKALHSSVSSFFILLLLAHTATLLEDGRVVVAGGMVRAPTFAILDAAEIYDPATNSWSSTDNLNEVRNIRRAAACLMVES